MGQLPEFHPQTVIRDWGDGQAFRLGDALTGVSVFGATGNGKTSGPAKMDSTVPNTGFPVGAVYSRGNILALVPRHSCIQALFDCHRVKEGLNKIRGNCASHQSVNRRTLPGGRDFPVT